VQGEVKVMLHAFREERAPKTIEKEETDRDTAVLEVTVKRIIRHVFTDV
jgi:hypothetical protein